MVSVNIQHEIRNRCAVGQAVTGGKDESRVLITLMASQYTPATKADGDGSKRGDNEYFTIFSAAHMLR